MGIERNKFGGDRKRIARVLVAGDDGEVEQVDLAIWHRPLTPAIQEELDAIRERLRAESDDGEAGSEEAVKRPARSLLIAQLAHVLTRWEITDGGTPVPPSAEALAEFEYEFLAAIQDAIFQPLYPKSTT